MADQGRVSSSCNHFGACWQEGCPGNVAGRVQASDGDCLPCVTEGCDVLVPLAHPYCAQHAPGRTLSPLNQRCSVCGAAAGQSCPTEARPLCGEARVDGAPCIRTAGHGPGHRAACVPERRHA